MDTARPKNKFPNVLHAANLRQQSDTWEESLRAWLQTLPSQETKKHVGNFLSVYRVRPTDEEGANSDNSDVDEPLHLTAESATKALQTQMPRKCQKQGLEGTDDAIALAEKAWPRKAGLSKPAPAHSSPVDVKRVLQAARKRAQPQMNVREAQWATREGTVRQEDFETTREDIDTWADSLCARSTATDEPLCNERQASFLRKIAQQVKADLCAEHEAEDPSQTAMAPLRWALHGGPGTGKSYTLRCLRTQLFQDVLGWEANVHFKFLTLQAVTAEQLDGDMIHHGVGLHGRKVDANVGSARMTELKRRGTVWRWLVLDEISMVSAELLCRLEMRCREIGPQDAMPWGGLNVVLAGDLWQLEPPKGTFIANLPLQWLSHGTSSKRPPAATGQALIWDTNAKHGIQGVTELIEVKRTDDAWLQHIQDQIRPW